MGWVAPRPAFSALGSAKADLMPTLDNTLARHVREFGVVWAAAGRAGRRTALRLSGA